MPFNLWFPKLFLPNQSWQIRFLSFKVIYTPLACWNPKVFPLNQFSYTLISNISLQSPIAHELKECSAGMHDLLSLMQPFKVWKRLSVHAPPASDIFKVLLPKWRHFVMSHEGVTSSCGITRCPDITTGNGFVSCLLDRPNITFSHLVTLTFDLWPWPSNLT